jgi:capsular exopolysaccharide synthesis family protein
MVTVSEAPGSKLINLKVRHKDPRVARDVMNAYIEEHTEWETFKRKRVSLEALKFLEKQLQDTQDALLLSLERLVSFTRDNGIVAMEGRGNHLSAFFQRASSMLAEADLQRKRARADQGRALEGGSASAFAGELARLESQYSSKTAIYNDDHPSVALLKKRLDAIKRKISSAKERTAQSRRRALDRRMDAQRELFQSAKDAGARVDELRVRYEILKRDVEKNERLFSMLSVRLNGVNMELKSITSPLTVVDPPSTPSEPMASKSLSMLLGLAMIGLLSGSFLAVCLELGPAKIRDATQLRHEVRARVLGVIPAANEIKTGYFEKTSKRDAIGAINGDPRSSVSEALRGVETVTSALMLEKCMRSLVVTSLYPSEGRTFISASLASALSSRHGNVLVVDSDLRGSGMGRVFRIPEHAAGLSDILRGEVDEFDYRKLVRKSRVKGLFFLPSGPPSSNPAALLASKKMRDLAAILSEDFDMVVFDSPPSQVFADSGAILRVAHALALVLEAGKTDAQDLNRAISGIPGAREKLLGFILNKADTRYLKYGRYGYYGYKSYSKVA